MSNKPSVGNAIGNAVGKPELHLAALPFPSYQGTQAAIRSMLETRHASGTRVELFTYGNAGYDWESPFPLHRGPEAARVALRSGPSVAKLLADARTAVPAYVRQ